MAILTPEQIASQRRHIDQDVGPAINIVSFTLTGVVTIITGLRFYARWKIKMPLNWDDWLCIPSLVSAKF